MKGTGRGKYLPYWLGREWSAVTPSVLRLNQNTKPCHEHHVYALLHVVNEKLNFIALILKLSSNLFLVQVILRARHLSSRERSIATKSNDKILSFTNY